MRCSVCCTALGANVPRAQSQRGKSAAGAARYTARIHGTKSAVTNDLRSFFRPDFGIAKKHKALTCDDANPLLMFGDD